MEPISVATTFATIVSLLSDFAAHRGVQGARTYDEFTKWLTEQRHEDVLRLLQSNAATVTSIKALLNQSSDAVLGRLESLDRTLATVASGIDEFRDIARIAYPDCCLSAQAIHILEQFHDSGATTILEMQFFSGETALAVVDGPDNRRFQFAEPRFIRDDLTTLVEFGMLDLSYNNSGSRLFRFKRTAAAFVERRRRA
jgi:hypothetical protein